MSLNNMGKIIQQKRKEHQLTQEELAQAMGVSKSSVSKWETGQTYPDIYLLPQLATYFSMTIDELMSYEPFLSKEKIKEYYILLSERFGSEPFEEVFVEYEQLVKKYYACPPFVFQMTVLLLNYLNLAEKARQQELLNYIVQLTNRVKKEGQERSLINQANLIEAFCYLQLGDIDRTLELLNYDVSLYMGEEQLLAQAYAAKGEIPKAKEVLQVAQYQHLMGLIVTTSDALLHENTDTKCFETMMKRMKGLFQLFEMEELHPFSVITFLNNAFIGLSQQGKKEEGLEILEEITGLMIKQQFPIEIHGDTYFNQLDTWLNNQLSFNNNMPRDERTIKQSLIDFYENYPVIVGLYQEDERFQRALQKLRKNNGENK